MRTKLFSFLAILAILFCFSSCEPTSINPDEQVLPANCANPIKATLRYNLCGIGLWGSYVLELADGTILQPWSGADAEIQEFQTEKDIAVWISYEETSKDNRYDSGVRCKALGEYENRISKVVHIKCIMAESKKICTVNATVRNNICGVGIWGALVLELEDGTILQPWASTDPSLGKLDLKPNQKVKIAYKEVIKDNKYDNMPICLAFGPYTEKIKATVEISCLTLVGAPIDETVYTTEAEVVDFDCAATGLWGGIQFKTKDIHLQPWINLTSFDPNATKPANGQRVKITYSQVEYNDKYKDIKVCPTLAPLPKSVAVKVHKIEILKN
jgi:hypothetical protein